MLRVRTRTHLHAGVAAHVLQERPLGDGAQTGHAPSRHAPQVAEVHISGQVGAAGVRQDVVQPVALEALKRVAR